MAYTFMSTGVDSVKAARGAWSDGDSFDGRATLTTEKMVPQGEKPSLAKAPRNTGAQASQMGALDQVIDAIAP